ncbi:hypothetical protein WMF37_28910 [Sorangium sp. So ce291]|uniref:hypothetical protein n=1 Tax=Sorangium sp. So ce291 TaxID=3133294 RepID=UPI003F61DB79
MFNCRNNTGKPLTLFSGTQTLVVLAKDQLGMNIDNAVTGVKLGGAAVVYARLRGNFVNNNAYVATIQNKNVQFDADGQPSVVFG